jgi:hypothetical protein
MSEILWAVYSLRTWKWYQKDNNQFERHGQDEIKIINAFRVGSQSDMSEILYDTQSESSAWFRSTWAMGLYNRQGKIGCPNL